ncbi:single-stranded DNA-binding protein (plasmid) [Pseudarthrobacter sp. P1]|uniref:single-stranded DNA-binding protein n=1 Tax=Pseudarthrobacter sp. P1 TaxID=3418418 RepID=UPI003CEC0543
MSMDTSITVTGNLTADPELRFTTAGTAVVNFTIASTPKAFDNERNAWVDGETLFLRAHLWRGAAENAAGSLTKGMRVIATGELKSRSYETKTGEKRTVLELEVEEIGPSLRYAAAAVHSSSRAAADAAEEERHSEEIHPVDHFSISARGYTGDDLWFGMDANPAGRISTRSQDPEPAY